MQKILVVGCGYTGASLASRLREAGCELTGTTRNRQRGATLTSRGIHVISSPLEDEKTLRQLSDLNPDMVVYLVPPSRTGTDPLPAVLQALKQTAVAAFVYGSTTSVYGDHGGGWVDEATPVQPGPLADNARIEAERLVMAAHHERGLPARICRISGIYGPGRTLRTLLEKGLYTLIEDHDSWVGRIHVDDLVSGLVAAGERGRNGEVYNLVDTRPHLSSEFANLSADLQGLPRPRWITEQEARARYQPDEFRRKVANKRLRCTKLVEELGVELRYPTYLEGLPASVTAEGGGAAG